MSMCSCCAESFKKRTSSKAFVRTSSNLRASLLAPPLSPRVPLTPIGWRKNDSKKVESPRVVYTELKLFSGDEPNVPEVCYEINPCFQNIKDDMKSATPFLPDLEELNDLSTKNPRKFSGAESAVTTTPRFSDKLTKKAPLDVVSDSNDETLEEGDSVLHHLKRQIRSDKRMLMVLHQELNEERNASAVAANNSMAMITILQAEKASIEMEALQYQRMMEEQAEYDQEAIQISKDMLIQKEKDIRVMECEIETYKERYGEIKKDEFVEVETSQQGDEKKILDFETERYQISDMLNNLENLIRSSSDAMDHENKDKGKEKKTSLEREMSIIKEKMSAIEGDSGYLKNAKVSLQNGEDRALLLTEIAQNLRRLRT